MNLYNGFRLLYRQKVVGVNSFDGVPLKALFSVRKADYVVEGLYINWMNCDSQQMCLNLWLFVETLKNPSPCFTWLFPFKESQKHLSDSKHVPQIKKCSESGVMTCLLSCLPQLTPASCGRWLPLHDTGSAGGFFLWKGGFSFPLSLSDWTSKCWGFLCIVGSANAVVIWWSINKIELNYFLQ